MGDGDATLEIELAYLTQGARDWLADEVSI